MEKVEKTLKSYLAMTSGMTIMMMALGIVFICAPGISLDVIRWIITCCLVAAGLYSIMASASISGVITLIFGAIIGLNPGVANIFPVLMGSYIVLSSFIKMFSLSTLRATAKPSFVIAAIMSMVGIVCGIVMIAHPDATNVFAMRLIGVMMLVYGISDFIDLLVMRQHLKSYTNALKGHKKAPEKKGTRISDIQEGQIVNKHK